MPNAWSARRRCAVAGGGPESLMGELEVGGTRAAICVPLRIPRLLMNAAYSFGRVRPVRCHLSGGDVAHDVGTDLSQRRDLPRHDVRVLGRPAPVAVAGHVPIHRNTHLQYQRPAHRTLPQLVFFSMIQRSRTAVSTSNTGIHNLMTWMSTRGCCATGRLAVTGRCAAVSPPADGKRARCRGRGRRTDYSYGLRTLVDAIYACGDGEAWRCRTPQSPEVAP